MDAAAYLAQAIQLLPSGKAWQVTPDSMLGQLLGMSADGSAALDTLANSLLDEVDPRTTTQMVADWETVVGLPNACTPASTDIDDRRAAIWQKYTDQGGQSLPYFVALGVSLGYDIVIRELSQFTCESRCTDHVGDAQWAFTWKITVRPVDEDTPPLAAFQNPGFECIIRTASPAHMVPIFSYPALPVPTLWFDFTEGL